MIDLTGAKVGDEYLLDSGEVIVVALTRDIGIICFERINCHGILFLTDINGEPTDDRDHDITIVSKVDPRPWLKDLPDADLFNLSVISIKVCEDNGWVYNMANHPRTNWHQINVMRMPALTGDQWKDSKISIRDLKVWQLTNQ